MNHCFSLVNTIVIRKIICESQFLELAGSRLILQAVLIGFLGRDWDFTSSFPIVDVISAC